MNNFGRRDFLKLMTAIPAGWTLSQIVPHLRMSDPSAPNIIVVVLDALTARNMSLYGYPRKTTPNIERLAGRANVYHAHHSAGTFTSPGVASLLTGTYPWAHRVINYKGQIDRNSYERNIFHLLNPHCKSMAFTQNYYADYILSQIGEDIDQHLPISSWSSFEFYSAEVPEKDHLMKFRSYDDFLLATGSSTPASLIFGTINKSKKRISIQNIKGDHLQYNSGELFYDINQVFSGIASQASNLESPSFCYFHLLPPHHPYLPSAEFNTLFQDGWQPVEKAMHPLAEKMSYEALNGLRTGYDQYLTMTDGAFGQFLDEVDKAGLLENSYLILTSDHGESFERGYWSHGGCLLFEPSIHVPLLISCPGQNTRHDFYSTTNSIDLLPTILKIFEIKIPDWCEGNVLPGFSEVIDNHRLTFSMDTKHSSAFGDLKPISIAMYRGDYKLIYYKGYGEEQSEYYKGAFEFYNLKDDPEEMNNLINDESNTARQLKELLIAAYNTANQPMHQAQDF